MATQEIKAMQGTVTEFFRNEQGGVLSFTLKGQQIRAMFFMNCLHINGKKCEPPFGQIKRFVKVGDKVEFDCVPNTRPNSYNIRWKASNVWKGARPPCAGAVPGAPAPAATAAAAAVPATPAVPTPVVKPAAAAKAAVASSASTAMASGEPAPASNQVSMTGLVLHLDTEQGVVSVKTKGGEELCVFDRKLSDATRMSEVKIMAHRRPKPLTVAGKFKCLWTADSVVWEGSKLKEGAESSNQVTSAWIQVEGKAKPRATSHPPAVPSPPVPVEESKALMIYNQVGTVVQDHAWKAVVAFNYNGVAQRGLLVAKKFDPPMETFGGALSKNDLVEFDAHEYNRPDGTDQCGWFLSRAKKVVDTSGPAHGEEDPTERHLVNVTATVIAIDDDSGTGILELLAASSRGNKILFEAKDVYLDRRPLVLECPLSTQVMLGETVKVNARPRTAAEPEDYAWIAQNVQVFKDLNAARLLTNSCPSPGPTSSSAQPYIPGAAASTDPFSSSSLSLSGSGSSTVTPLMSINTLSFPNLVAQGGYSAVGLGLGTGLGTSVSAAAPGLGQETRTQEVNNNKPYRNGDSGGADVGNLWDRVEDEINWSGDEDFDAMDLNDGTNGDGSQDSNSFLGTSDTPPMLSVPPNLHPQPHRPVPVLADPTIPRLYSAPAPTNPTPPPAVPSPASTSSTTSSVSGLQALIQAQTIQNHLIIALLKFCSLDVNMHAQAVQNKLILSLLEGCDMEAIQNNVPLLKQWMDLNPTLVNFVREAIVKKQTSQSITSAIRGRTMGMDSGLGNSSSVYGPYSLRSDSVGLGTMGDMGASLPSMNNHAPSSSSSSAVGVGVGSRFGSYASFEPSSRPAASQSPIGTVPAAKITGIGSLLPASSLISDPRAVSGEVVIVKLIDDLRGIAKFCDGGPHNGQEVEFSKNVCRFLGKPLSLTAHMPSVVRPDGLGTCRAIKSDNLNGPPWRAEELHIN